MMSMRETSGRGSLGSLELDELLENDTTRALFVKFW
jgi:hypothetical protein